ncbi:MAG: hypothetical protein KDH17_20380, partial [Rhodocyclaceae bacterium]|nr:hypothetical protein [Rhodocyclaceae bacterium]
TAFGLIGSTVTGFFGMNLLSIEELGTPLKLAYFGSVFAAVTWLAFYTVMKSKGLSDFLDALSDERVTIRQKVSALLSVWQRPRGD